MSTPDAFEFAAPVLRQEDGMRYHYIPIPAEMAAPLIAAGVRRVQCSINGTSTNRGIVSRGDGSHMLITGQAFLREVGARYGDTVTVSMLPDPDPERVELCEEFEAALEQDDEAAERFCAMTPGRRRSLAYYVNSAKRADTRIRRALDIAHKLRTRTLYGDGREE